MSSFPLFDSLYNDTKDLDHDKFNNDQMNYILENVSELDENARELFFAIIRYHHIKKCGYTIELPYNSKQLKSGIRIDFEKLENHLKFMLYEFMKRDDKKKKEDVIFLKNKNHI